jgi:Skp family chaperone for outer membrane proteins
MVNLGYVLKNCRKFKTFSDEMKATVRPFQEKDVRLKKECEALLKESQKSNFSPERREAIIKRVRELKRDGEDNKLEAQKTIEQKQNAQLKILYADVEDAASRYARAHDLDLVVQYQDAVTEAERHSPQNIARKMQAGPFLPLYAAPGVDISKEIVAVLNARFKAKESD